MSELPRVRPGWQTTEFWTTLLAQIIGIAVIFRIVPETDAAVLSGQVTSVVQGVFAIIATVGSLWLYVRSRTQVKVADKDLQVADKQLQIAKIAGISGATTKSDKDKIRAM